MSHNLSKTLRLVIGFWCIVNFELGTFPAVRAGEWRWKTRLQPGFEFDHNIFEQRQNPVADELLKLIGESQLRIFYKKFYGSFQYHGGLQHYLRTPSEHKFIQSLHTNLVYQLQPSLWLGFNGSARFKYFNQANREYWLTHGETFCQWQFTPFQITGIFQLNRLDYPHYNQFDFHAQSGFGSVTYRHENGIFWMLKAGYQFQQFKRSALKLDFLSRENIATERPQRDENFQCLLQAGYQKTPLATLEFLYLQNHSNSYGFTYQLRRFTGSIASPLYGNILLRLFVGIQAKKYDEALDKIILTELDTEREQSNFFIGDFSRRLTANIDIFLRLSWFNNESPFPGQYYHKQLTTISFEYRF